MSNEIVINIVGALEALGRIVLALCILTVINTGLHIWNLTKKVK